MYDYLIVGAGLYGAVCAHELSSRGKRCLVIDRRSHIGGNLYTENISGIQVHKYGAHIFHTSDPEIWAYVQQFSEFNHFINSPLAVYHDELYNLPFNMNTFSRLWGVRTPEEAKQKIQEQIQFAGIEAPENLEQQALRLVGPDVYMKLIKGYTEKQWGRDCKDLPAFIIKRIPCRFTYNNNYFNDPYQGIPVGGYTEMIQKMLQNTDVLLNTDFKALQTQNGFCAKKIIYSGCIDEFFDYQLGQLQYRSLRFDTEELPIPDYQGNAVVNYTAREIPYTRIIEHKHFEFGSQPTTVITKEYPVEWKPGMEPYYPVNDDRNTQLHQRYQALAAQQNDVIFGGRLGNFQYYDMDQVIRKALNDLKSM